MPKGKSNAETGGIGQFEPIARPPSWIWERPRYGVTIHRAVGECSRPRPGNGSGERHRPNAEPDTQSKEDMTDQAADEQARPLWTVRA